MTVRQKSSTSEAESPGPLLSARALLLLLCAALAGGVAFVWPSLGVALLVAVAVLTLLSKIVGD